MSLIGAENMVYKEQLLILVNIIISIGAKNTSPIWYKPDRTEMKMIKKVEPGKEFMKNVDYAKKFKSLRQIHSPGEMQIVSTLDLLSSALKVEEAMRENIHRMTHDLLEHFRELSPKENIQKLIAIEETINHDKLVVAILIGLLQYARDVTTLDALKKEMQHILHEVSASNKNLEKANSFDGLFPI